MCGDFDFRASVSIRSFSSVLYALPMGLPTFNLSRLRLRKTKSAAGPRDRPLRRKRKPTSSLTVLGPHHPPVAHFDTSDDRFVAVDEHPAPDYAADVSDRIGSEGCRLGVPQLVGNEVFIGQIADRPNAFLTWSVMLLKPCSSSRFTICSAVLARVLEGLFVDSRMRLRRNRTRTTKHHHEETVP